MKKLISILAIPMMMYSCDHRKNLSDAYGNFEADEIIVSAEATGKILQLSIDEGIDVKANAHLGWIDTITIAIGINQANLQQAAIRSKADGISAQIETLKQQKANLEVNLRRVMNMLPEGAATLQQKDDLEGQIKLVDKQIVASQVQIASVKKEAAVLDAQMSLLNEQLLRCMIKSPIDGLILEKYIKEGEMVVAGKPLFKIANLNVLDLRCYIAGSELSKLKLGEEVKVLIDKGDKEMEALKGTVKWISSEAEFTPKIIQTKQERVKQVYAVKIAVKNDGRLKIGMPGEMVISQ
jgi:HlyD family secretion protein